MKTEKIADLRDLVGDNRQAYEAITGQPMFTTDDGTVYARLFSVMRDDGLGVNRFESSAKTAGASMCTALMSFYPEIKVGITGFLYADEQTKADAPAVNFYSRSENEEKQPAFTISDLIQLANLLYASMGRVHTFTGNLTQVAAERAQKAFNQLLLEQKKDNANV